MSIELVVGPMFSSKTTTLFAKLRRYKIAGHHVVLFKYANDLRYTSETDKACTHDKMEMTAIPIKTVDEITSDMLTNKTVIGFDEGQFIVGLAEFALKHANNNGTRIVIAALDSTFNMQPWPIVSDLFAISEQITKLHAVCYNCKQDAAFTKRKDTTNQSLEVIGGSDQYVASCRKCHSQQN